MLYRKKPVVVEAVQFNGENELEIKDFVGDSLTIDLIREPQVTEEGIIPKWVELKINTLEGTMVASVGDYIIKGVNGEFYPCKPDIFEKSYDKLGEEIENPPIQNITKATHPPKEELDNNYKYHAPTVDKVDFYNDFYHFGKIIGEYQFTTSSCYSKKEVNEMDCLDNTAKYTDWLTKTYKPTSFGDTVEQLEPRPFVEKTGCNHKISIELINGNYVSYCMQCGKIFEERKSSQFKY